MECGDEAQGGAEDGAEARAEGVQTSLSVSVVVDPLSIGTARESVSRRDQTVAATLEPVTSLTSASSGSMSSSRSRKAASDTLKTIKWKHAVSHQASGIQVTISILFYYKARHSRRKRRAAVRR